MALDSFPDGKEYIEERTGDAAEQYQSPDGKYYQIPWKANPVMIFYNKDLMKKAGVDPENPPLATYDEFLATSEKIVSSGAAEAAIWPAPTSEFFQSWFDFYPLYAAETGGTQLVEDGKATFNSPEGEAVAEFWKTMYDEGYSQNEKYNGDSFADGKAAMAIVGPWAIAVYGENINWGAAPVPTSAGTSAEETYTFSDAKNVAIYSACKAQGHGLGGPEVRHQRGAGRLAAGEHRPDADAGRTSRRRTPTTSRPTPTTQTFAAQAARTVEVPNVANSIEIWQTFRDEYSKSVIFGETEVADALSRGRRPRWTTSPAKQ